MAKKLKSSVYGLLIPIVAGILLSAFAMVFVPTQPKLPIANYSGTAQAAAVSNPFGTNIIADTVAKTGPAVVKIETVKVQSGQSLDPYSNDPFFRQFFGNQVPMRTQPNIQQGMGSGFIISKDGYILTNEHVIHGANKIEVTIVGRDKPVAAKVVGSDAQLDLAVLKINAGNNLTYLELGNSDNVRVGEWVIAIGNPYGLDHTVTTGVISAKGRPVIIENREYKNLLQTDASINPGNSGGPLLNLQGQVVGINTAVNAGAQGIGFAIPSNIVNSVVDTLISKGKIERAWMGVYLQSMTPELAGQFGLTGSDGVIVAGVITDGPADRAGIQQGDVILEIDKQKVKDASDVTSIVEGAKVGRKLVLLVSRNGNNMYVPVTLGEKA